jgi:hypothetical protein
LLFYAKRAIPHPQWKCEKMSGFQPCWIFMFPVRYCPVR